MKNKYHYIRRITPNELADFLNSKGVSNLNFRCPICNTEHQTLIDNMPIEDDKSDVNVVLQPVLPAFVYPRAEELKSAIDQKDYPEHYQQLTQGQVLGVINQSVYREVIHLVCDNCGYVRTFSKDAILSWLLSKGEF